MVGARACLRRAVECVCPCCVVTTRRVGGYIAADEARREAVVAQQPPPPAADVGVPLVACGAGDARLVLTQHCAGPGDAPPVVPLLAELVRVVYQQRGTVAVLQVVLSLDTGVRMRACLKIRTDVRMFARERNTYWQMRQDGCAGLFVRLHFFCVVRQANGATWMGYCMDMAEHTVAEMLSVRPLQADAMMCGPRDGSGGVEVRGGCCVHDGLVCACLQVMRGMHGTGWVHGDSHAGNFMYCRGRVYAIDFERSFRSPDAVQHLLDLQELFGHASGVLTDVGRTDAWDLQHMLGIYCRSRARADEETPDGLATALLPLCSCFTESNEARRLRGCRLCLSAQNRAVAERMMSGDGSAICDAVAAAGLGRIRVALMKTRLECMRECRTVVDIILRCFADPAMQSSAAARVAAEGMGKMQRAARRGRGEPSERSACASAVWVMLYAPALDEPAAHIAQQLVQGLRDGGYNAEADTVRDLVAAPLAILL